MAYWRRVDPVVMLLFIGVVLFTGVLFACEKMFYQDAQIFQVIAGIDTGIAGALLGRLKPDANHGQPAEAPAPTEPKP